MISCRVQVRLMHVLIDCWHCQLSLHENGENESWMKHSRLFHTCTRIFENTACLTVKWDHVCICRRHARLWLLFIIYYRAALATKLTKEGGKAMLSWRPYYVQEDELEFLVAFVAKFDWKYVDSFITELKQCSSVFKMMVIIYQLCPCIFVYRRVGDQWHSTCRGFDLFALSIWRN